MSRLPSPTAARSLALARADFAVRRANVLDNLDRLTALVRAGLNVPVDEIHWGNVGDLQTIEAAIAQQTDRLFGEGEHAGPALAADGTPSRVQHVPYGLRTAGKAAR